jgi:hypothetical protein
MAQLFGPSIKPPVTRTLVLFPSAARSTAAGTLAATSGVIATRGAKGIRFDVDVTAVAGGNFTYQIESWDQAKQAWVAEIGLGQAGAPTHQVTQIDPRLPPGGGNTARQPPARLRVVTGGPATTATFSVSYTLGD